ncbi:MAG TPA: helix-turn-helix transcriptional regulator [Polyangiaceae bacterium]|nr:helix-turn-helix transcriptional regulator [Polyangiaceae bacterium]
MDRPSVDSDAFAPDSAPRVSLGDLSSQPDDRWESSPPPNDGSPEALSAVWAALCAGQLRIVQHAQDELHTILYLEERRADELARWALRGRPLTVLERVFLGQSLNFIALDLGFSSSTVSAEFQVAMRTLGLKARLSCLPVHIPQLWHASRAHPVGATAAGSGWHGARFATVALPRPELRLASVLSRAELEVSTMVLQGKTHAEIASVRGTSARTVANQLASIFGKLDVSGRQQLVTTLAAGSTHGSKPHGQQRAPRQQLDDAEPWA